MVRCGGPDIEQRWPTYGLMKSPEFAAKRLLSEGSTAREEAREKSPLRSATSERGMRVIPCVP